MATKLKNIRNLKIFLSETISYQIWHVALSSGSHQVSSNDSPGVKFDLALGVTSFTWASIRKTLEIFPYLAMRPRVTEF